MLSVTLTTAAGHTNAHGLTQAQANQLISAASTWLEVNGADVRALRVTVTEEGRTPWHDSAPAALATIVAQAYRRQNYDPCATQSPSDAGRDAGKE